MLLHTKQLFLGGLTLAAAAVPVLAVGAAVAVQQPVQEESQEATKAKPTTVEDVVAAANRVCYYQGRDRSSKVSMEIVDAQGRKRMREMTILRRNEPEPEGTGSDEAILDCSSREQSFYVRFQRPADVDKTTFMVHKKPGSDDDRWLYLPALDLVKRVSSADKRSSFVGSHFYYEDVSGRHLQADERTLVETTDNYWVVEAKPKDPTSVEFASYKMWVHRVSAVVVKMEYKDAKKETYRTYEVLGVETIQGNPTVVKAKMTDLRTKGSTTVTYSAVKYDIGLPEDLFTERYLRRAPRKFVK
jgi:outer membrane lipoprotein-sorting protein/DNA-directed RNA polymerase subunit M/transcription elongation factor TFIIS